MIGIDSVSYFNLIHSTEERGLKKFNIRAEKLYKINSCHFIIKWYSRDVRKSLRP